LPIGAWLARPLSLARRYHRSGHPFFAMIVLGCLTGDPDGLLALLPT
jgi:hypothetical protein